MRQRAKFTDGLDHSWSRVETGGGCISIANGVLRLEKHHAAADVYANAQLDDYQPLRRRDFLWRPPLTFSIRARFSHDAENGLSGTAGFGFWNDPFMMTDDPVVSQKRPAPPRAIWFFYSSPPSNMQLALDVPGYGWKAATIDAQRIPFYCLLPAAPIAIPLMHIDPFYRALWPIAQRALNVSEALITQPMADWHTYRIDWLRRTATFTIDDRLVFECKTPPRGPLGLVIWIDNQFMVVTPQGRIRHGLVNSEKIERMEIEWFEIENL